MLFFCNKIYFAKKKKKKKKFLAQVLLNKIFTSDRKSAGRS